MLSELLLHPDLSLHVRELARLTGASPGSLHRELRAWLIWACCCGRRSGARAFRRWPLMLPTKPSCSARWWVDGAWLPHVDQYSRPSSDHAPFAGPQTLGVSRATWIFMDSLRKKRNLSDDSGDLIEPSAVKTCIDQADALLSSTQRWLERHRPDLMPAKK